jgi:hypothetical protein
VSEQQDVIEDLEASGVLAGIRWAYRAATSRALEIYSEPDGHDAALLGNLRFTLFRDRLDRVFACDPYDLQPGSAATAHIDLLYAELAQEHISSMPHLAPDLVVRSDLTGSPGWAVGGRRFLLASCAFGKLDSLLWARKSLTKQRVARQLQPDPLQGTLFDEAADEEIAGLVELLASAHSLDLETFVLAHSLNAFSQDMELVFGRPRLNKGGGEAWHWYQDLLTTPPGSGKQQRNGGLSPAGPDSVPDAPVRLRRRRNEQPRNRAGGEA